MRRPSQVLISCLHPSHTLRRCNTAHSNNTQHIDPAMQAAWSLALLVLGPARCFLLLLCERTLPCLRQAPRSGRGRSSQALTRRLRSAPVSLHHSFVSSILACAVASHQPVPAFLSPALHALKENFAASKLSIPASVRRRGPRAGRPNALQQAHIPAQQPRAQEPPRLPRAPEGPRRAQGDRTEARARTSPPDSLTRQLLGAWRGLISHEISSVWCINQRGYSSSWHVTVLQSGAQHCQDCHCSDGLQ